MAYTSSKSKKDEKGVINDQFYTKPDVASKLASMIQFQPWYSDVERVVEPSAGRGAFSDLFPGCLAFDIAPAKENIKQADFLAENIEPGPVTLSIGNPPFGRQGSLALKFVKKCCTFSDYVAFILPRSFQKTSVQNRVPLTHSLLLNDEVGEAAFCLADGQPYDVPCVFQVWYRQPREKITEKKTCDFFYWSDKEHGQLAIRRVGFYAGRSFDGQQYESSSPLSHYYITCKPELVEPIRIFFNTFDWSVKSSSVAGPRSLSKGEIVEIVDIYFKEQWNAKCVEEAEGVGSSYVEA